MMRGATKTWPRLDRLKWANAPDTDPARASSPEITRPESVQVMRENVTRG
jgi:hypothetical protein